MCFLFHRFLNIKKKWTSKIISEIKKKKPQIIINCSANQNLNSTKNNLRNLISTNIYSNIMFLEEAFKNDKFKGYISFGTKWELGDTKQIKPLNFYAATKNANESFYKFYASDTVSIISLKLFDTYGQFDKRKKFLNDLRKSYNNNKTLNITAGQQFLDYVHINDICTLVSKIVNDIKTKKLKGFKTFTASSKKPIRLIDLIKDLNKVLNKKLKVKVGKKKYRKNESINPTKKIFNYPGWKSNYNLIKELKTIFENKNI